MKSIIKTSAIIITVVFLFCGCTVQDKMNPIIFSERFSSIMNDDIIIDESFTDNNRHIMFFSDKSGEKYACELLTDTSYNIKKICLASNNTNKAESFKYIFEKIVNVYTPDENSDEIIQNLFKNKWNYHSTQWYDYSCVVSDEGIFASIENKKLSTESDADLTLKQSDIIHP